MIVALFKPDAMQDIPEPKEWDKSEYSDIGVGWDDIVGNVQGDPKEDEKKQKFLMQENLLIKAGFSHIFSDNVLSVYMILKSKINQVINGKREGYHIKYKQLPLNSYLKHPYGPEIVEQIVHDYDSLIENRNISIHMANFLSSWSDDEGYAKFIEIKSVINYKNDLFDGIVCNLETPLMDFSLLTYKKGINQGKIKHFINGSWKSVSANE